MTETVKGVLDTLDASARGGATMSVDDIVQAFGRRAYGPLVFAIGLVMLSPVNWIPGAGVLLASVLTVLMVQSLVISGAPWVPRWLGRASVDRDRARHAITRVRPWVERLAVVVRPRLRPLTRPPWRSGPILVIIATALSMYPLAIVPGGAGPPSLAITVFGLALTVEDGLLVLLALLAAAAGFALAAWAIL